MTPKRHDVSHRRTRPLSYVHGLSKISYDRFKAHQHCLQSSDTKAVSIFYYTAYGSYRGWKQLKPRKEFVLFYKKKKKAKQQPSSSICWCFSNSFLDNSGAPWHRGRKHIVWGIFMGFGDNKTEYRISPASFFSFSSLYVICEMDHCQEWSIPSWGNILGWTEMDQIWLLHTIVGLFLWLFTGATAWSGYWCSY